MRRKRKSPKPSQRRDAGRVTVYSVASRLPAPTDIPSKFVRLLAKGYWRGEGPPREPLASGRRDSIAVAAALVLVLCLIMISQSGKPAKYGRFPVCKLGPREYPVTAS